MLITRAKKRFYKGIGLIILLKYGCMLKKSAQEAIGLFDSVNKLFPSFSNFNIWIGNGDCCSGRSVFCCLSFLSLSWWFDFLSEVLSHSFLLRGFYGRCIFSCCWCLSRSFCRACSALAMLRCSTSRANCVSVRLFASK